MIKKIYIKIVYYLLIVFTILSVWACVDLYFKQLGVVPHILISGIFTLLFLAAFFSIVENGLCKKIQTQMNSIVVFVEQRKRLFLIVIPVMIKMIIIVFCADYGTGDIEIYIRNSKDLVEYGVIKTYIEFTSMYPYRFLL